MTPESLLAELCNTGVVLEAADGQLRLEAPRGALTPEMLSAVKSCKQDLLKILPGRSLLPDDLGASESHVSPNTAPGTQVDYITRSNKVDAEFRRFEQVAEPLPDGSGWFDPTQAPVPVGVPIEDWQRFERDCGNLGRSKSASTPRNPEQLEDQQCLIRS